MTLSNNKRRFVVLDVVPPSTPTTEIQENLKELLLLIDSYKGATVVQIIQRRDFPDPATYIGRGKAEELTSIVKDKKIEVVVINAIVPSTQLFHLTQILWRSNPLIQVWDRIDLILNIFDKHARTAEAQLQIKIARMRHMGPRIYGLAEALGRQAGGIGTRGIGETNIERMKRHWRREIKLTEAKLHKLAEKRERQLVRRREIGLKTVSIIGYTNAGKTTLFNALTGKTQYAADVLFATLDSVVGRLYLPRLKDNMLVSDTIGFIQNLPAKLIDAFKSTLMESISADLLLQVIDAADQQLKQKMSVVEQMLAELQLSRKPRILVFNKCDLLTQNQIKILNTQRFPLTTVFISLKPPQNLDKLITLIEKQFTIY